MGRYWNSNNHSGKFGFGCQLSNDHIEWLGMEEQEPSEIIVIGHIDSSSEDKVKAKIDECYDFLGVPKSKRIYDIEEYVKIEDKICVQYVYKQVKEDKHAISCGYSMGKEYDVEGYTWKERKPLSNLYVYRLHMALCVYDDLKKDGYSTLYGET